MTEITLRWTGQYFRWTCDFCGEPQEKDGMLSCIGPQDQHNSPEICQTCLDAGPEGAIERAKKYAERVQEHAKSLIEDVPEIIHGVSAWRTGADYKAVFDAGEEELQKHYTVVEIGQDAQSTQGTPQGADDIPF